MRFLFLCSFALSLVIACNNSAPPPVLLSKEIVEKQEPLTCLYNKIQTVHTFTKKPNGSFVLLNNITIHEAVIPVYEVRNGASGTMVKTYAPFLDIQGYHQEIWLKRKLLTADMTEGYYYKQSGGSYTPPMSFIKGLECPEQ